MITVWTIRCFMISVTAISGQAILQPIPGFYLENNNSAVCADVHIPDMDNFILCSFLKVKSNDDFISNKTIFRLWKSNDTFQLTYRYSGLFGINYRNESHVYQKLINPDEWLKVCVIVTDGIDIVFQVNNKNARNINDVEPVWEKEGKKGTSEIHQDSHRDISAVQLCAGSDNNEGQSIIGAVAGIITQPNQKGFRLTMDKDVCLFDEYHETSASYWNILKKKYGKVEESLFSLEEICWDTQVFLIFNDSSFFDEHLSRCQSISGRIIQSEELLIYSERLDLNISAATEEIGQQYMWLHGGLKGTKTLASYCPVYNLTDHTFGNIPCIIELDINFCIVPKYLEFFYYGSLLKYDNYYLLHAKNNTMFLEGNETSFLEWNQNHWCLRSYTHKKVVTLHNFTLPVGRQKWKSDDGQNEYLLTFTFCGLDQFSCSNGLCVPFFSRCNGSVECIDESDEENCKLINKKLGYSKSKTPPPTRNNSVFEIIYFPLIFNIADISSSDGIAVVDLLLVMIWHDSRITFHNPSVNEEVNCSEIWAPVISMNDNAEKGIKIKFESYRSICTIMNTNDFREEKVIIRRITGDPYMGVFVDGNAMKLVYTFSGLVTVPCRFQLRKYPFGKQTCNITFWPDNAFLFQDITKYKFVKANTNSNTLLYNGVSDLGEFRFLSATHDYSKHEHSVTISINLQNLFGFHLLSSFTPSFLISIITYASLFFPITDFNERVMVSLTGLLVLAALFTQSSNTSVKTPYFKYLDIWYVVLIIFCFFVVIANMIINKLTKMGEFKNEDPKLQSILDSESKPNIDFCRNIWLKKVYNVNTILEVVFAVFLSLFIATYILGASDII